MRRLSPFLILLLAVVAALCPAQTLTKAQADGLYLKKITQARLGSSFRGQTVCTTRLRTYEGTTQTVLGAAAVANDITYGIAMRVDADTENIRFCYGNWKTSAASGGNDVIATTTAGVTLKVGLEVSVNGTNFTSSVIFPLVFGNSETAAFSSTAIQSLETSPFPFLPAGTLIRIRTDIHTTGTGDPFPVNVLSNSTALDLKGTTDMSWSGTMATNGGVNFYAPYAAVGTRIGARKPSLVICGDSITNATGDTSQYGWLLRALDANTGGTNSVDYGGFSELTMTHSGAKLSEWMDLITAVYGRARPIFAGDVVVMMLGTNDIQITSAATMISNYQTVVNRLAAAGCRVVACTVLAKTASTDSWATTAHQYPCGQNITGIANNGSGLIRLAYSAASTNNCPNTGDSITIGDVVGTGGLDTAVNGLTFTVTKIDTTHCDLVGSAFVGAYTSGGAFSENTQEAARTGLNNAIRSGTIKNLAFYIDTSQGTEVDSSNNFYPTAATRNGGRIHLTAGVVDSSNTTGQTPDGIHPNTQGHINISGTVTLSKFSQNLVAMFAPSRTDMARIMKRRDAFAELMQLARVVGPETALRIVNNYAFAE